ncbi:FAD:protein FMN transferase [Ruminococcus flavefaciens]|uniref:FAD:protein FMN transferase n=1 Tax=Ruminococcus flavefaciens TaxID=1265 RepID=UPI00048E6243|nr:FAD:protein FMN transferase [Ruminococcus flavefaciens]
MLKKVLAVTLFLSGLMFSGGCSEEKAVSEADMSSSSRDVFAMDTFMNMKAYGSNADIALSEAEERILQLEEELSVTSETSDIWAVDHSSGAVVDVSEDTALIINKAIEMGNKTNGALDITLYPVLKEWGFTTGDYKVPDDNTLISLLKNVDYSKVHIAENTVTLPKETEIDLGALAKGYTGDEIMKIMEDNGVSSAIVSLGGNVQALGSKPDGSNWKVSVRDPFAPDTDMCIIEVADKAVITSGNYERYFTAEDGTVYWHILDPKDGYPADNGLVSVTVIGDCGLDCDALSTALFVEGYDGAVDFLRSDPSFDLILVTDDRKIYYSSGIADCFTNISSMEAEVISLD